MKHGFLFFTIAVGLILGGCHASDETSKDQTEPAPPPQASATEMMQKDLVTLRSANDSLLQLVTKLQQDNRSAAAHNAELETQIGQLKEQLAAIPPPPPKPAMANVKEGYAHALQLFHSKNYEESSALFQEVLDAGAPVTLQDHCDYWLGECAYGQKHYAEAIDHFKKVFEFKISKKKDDAQMMIANSYLAMGEKVKAKAEYDRLIKKFPASPYVERAKAKLSTLSE
ncbi:MAG TPA: tetratricopeptide repeat protein, partial [Bacteroidota bacterium]|nr:tetratricopeptide repeat protein [Bacteroidota bacterium]